MGLPDNFTRKRTKFKNIEPLLPKIKNKNKNKIRLKFSKVKNTPSLSQCQMFLYKKKSVYIPLQVSDTASEKKVKSIAKISYY